MSFCVLILGGSSAWSADDWNSFFSVNEIQPEEIIPNIFSCGSANVNIIPTWAPTPTITCHAYLSSQKDIRNLLDLNGKSYKDRTLYFEVYDPEKSNLTIASYNNHNHDQHENNQHINNINIDPIISNINNTNADKSPFGDIPQPTPKVPNMVSFDIDSDNNTMSDVQFVHQDININHKQHSQINTRHSSNTIQIEVTSPIKKNHNARRSFTISADNPITDYRQILQKYQQNEDRDIDYANYMHRNFDTLPSNKGNGVFKRRETYASYLQFQHLGPTANMSPDEQAKYKKKLQKKQLKKIKTTPNYREMSKSKSVGMEVDDEDNMHAHNIPFTLQDHGQDAHEEEAHIGVSLLDDYSANITNTFYGGILDSDEEEQSEEEKYDNFIASDFQRLKEDIENTKVEHHQRMHSRDHTRQKTLFDAIGSIAEKLGIIQGASKRQSMYSFDNLHAATPPPILTENKELDDNDMNVPSIISTGPTVKFAEHMAGAHPMKRRRSSLPDNFVFCDRKRFTVNDPNSNWRTEHSFISLTALQAQLVHKNPSKGLQTLQASMLTEGDPDLPRQDSPQSANTATSADTERRMNAMMNKDYHMHEQLLPQTIIKIVKSMKSIKNSALTDTGFIRCPYEYEYDTVAMFIDVSGFTKMTELLDQEGPWGGEKVAFYLNRYLEQVARIVASEGGDIFKFAGDAMIIIWPFNDDQTAQSEHDLQSYHQESMGRAIQCGMNIQKELHQTSFTSGVVLSVKIGIGFGKCKIVFVGGTLDRCEYLACGEPLSQAFLCENNAKPGEVIIHRDIESIVDRNIFVTQWIADSDCYKVAKQRKKIRTKRNRGRSKKGNQKNKYEFTDAETVKRLNQFIPQAAKTRLVHRYRRWHQESRMMTVIFINLDFLAFDKLPINILQQILETMQVALYRYEGSLNKFMYDDKGATAVAVFGLPPICNFDDAARGVYAALQIERVLKSLKGIMPELPEHAAEAIKLKRGLSKKAGGSLSASSEEPEFLHLKLRKVSIGVTSGRVYCGLLGSGGSGCEYGILGDLVNLSARLMQHAGKPISKGGLGVNEGGVLCSKEIKIQCDDCRNLQFAKLKPIQVKGKSSHIEVFRPNYRAVLGETIIYRSRYNIGFTQEYDIIEQKIKQMIHEKGEARGAIICVEGHHWYGCTHFAREIMARLRKYIYIVGASAIKYEETQLVVWQALMARMTRECHLLHGDDEGFKDSVYRFFADTGMEGILPAIWVANDLLGTKFHIEPEQEESIKAEEKMNFMTEIVLHFLRIVSQYAPLLLVIVKHQFMSKDDWFLTHAVCKKIKSGELRNVSFMVTGWPQRNKSYSNRYSHRDAAMCYKTFREEYCNTNNNIINAGSASNEVSNAELIKKTAVTGMGNADCATTVQLPRWTKSEVEQFLKVEFDIKRCSPMLVKFLHNKAGGIPAMSKALVRDHHLVFVKNGGNLDCSSIEKLGDLALGFKETDIHFAIPASIQSYFGKMLDSLNDYANSQFILITIKTAALICVGQEFQSLAFALDTLRSCHPLFNDCDEMYFNDEFEEAIEILVFEGFIRRGFEAEAFQQFNSLRNTKQKQKLHFYGYGFHEANNNVNEANTNKKSSFYVFTSGFCRDVIYNLMLFKQRSELHKSVSEVLRKYDALLTASNMANNEVRNALRRHETLLQFDGMKSNFEIESEQNKNINLNDSDMNLMNSSRGKHRFVDSQQLFHQNSKLPRFDIGAQETPIESIRDMDEYKQMSELNEMNRNRKRNQNRSELSFDGYDDYDLESPYPPSIASIEIANAMNNINMNMNSYMNNYRSIPSSVLVVYLMSARNIPRLDAWQIPNLYVTFHYGNGKEQHLSRSVITSNSDDNDDPIWNEYAAIPLSRELLTSNGYAAPKITLKFWDYSPIRPDDDVMIGKICIDLLHLYEEQIKQQRHLEHKLRTPRNSVSALNFQYGLKKQLEDRDYIYVSKSMKMIIDDDLKQCVPNGKQASMFEAMFKFCVLPNESNSNENENENENEAPNQNENGHATFSMNESRELRTSEMMKKMNMALHENQLSELDDLNELSGGPNNGHNNNNNNNAAAHIGGNMSMVGNINHMPQMSHIEQQQQQQFMPHHLQQSTGLAKYVSSLNTKNINQNIAQPPLLQNYSNDDSYFLTQLENEEEIPFHDQESLDYDSN